VILRKSRRELERMAAAGSVVARTLALLRDRAKPGVTTGELDLAAEAFIRDQGGVPTFKGYHGFPASICASPNDMVVHGIPDVGVTLRGWVADSGYTFWIGEGEPPEDVRRLLTACRASLFAAVEQCVDGHHLSDLGHAVQTRVEADGFGVIRSLVGHGVGRRMHEDPQIPNYGLPGRGQVLRPGMTLAVEPMITASGVTDVQLDEGDGWSIYSADHSLTAHYEHTVAVTDDGPLILTRHDGWSPVDDDVGAGP
jgi:methionyl aminopeptidase